MISDLHLPTYSDNLDRIVNNMAIGRFPMLHHVCGIPFRIILEIHSQVIFLRSK